MTKEDKPTKPPELSTEDLDKVAGGRHIAKAKDDQDLLPDFEKPFSESDKMAPMHHYVEKEVEPNYSAKETAGGDDSWLPPEPMEKHVEKSYTDLVARLAALEPHEFTNTPPHDDDLSKYHDTEGDFDIDPILPTPAPDVTPEEAEAAFEVALADVLVDGITAEDVERAKARFKARLAYAKDSPMTAARTLGASLSVGMRIDDVENYPEELAKVTVDQVRDAARRLFSENSSATGILLPKSQAALEGTSQ